MNFKKHRPTNHYRNSDWRYPYLEKGKTGQGKAGVKRMISAINNRLKEYVNGVDLPS